MLVLTRRSGQAIYVGDDIVITVVEIKGNQVRLGITAPSDCKIFREEIYQQIVAENLEAAQQATGVSSNLKELGKNFSVKKQLVSKRKIGDVG